TLGIARLAVVYQDIPFGKNGLVLVDKLEGPLKVEILGRVPAPAGADDLKAAAAELRKTGAQTYLLILAPNSRAALVRDGRLGGGRSRQPSPRPGPCAGADRIRVDTASAAPAPTTAGRATSTLAWATVEAAGCTERCFRRAGSVGAPCREARRAAFASAQTPPT